MSPGRGSPACPVSCRAPWIPCLVTPPRRPPPRTSLDRALAALEHREPSPARLAALRDAVFDSARYDRLADLYLHDAPEPTPDQVHQLAVDAPAEIVAQHVGVLPWTLDALALLVARAPARAPGPISEVPARRSVVLPQDLAAAAWHRIWYGITELTGRWCRRHAPVWAHQWRPRPGPGPTGQDWDAGAIHDVPPEDAEGVAYPSGIQGPADRPGQPLDPVRARVAAHAQAALKVAPDASVLLDLPVPRTPAHQLELWGTIPLLERRVGHPTLHECLLAHPALPLDAVTELYRLLPPAADADPTVTWIMPGSSRRLPLRAESVREMLRRRGDLPPALAARLRDDLRASALSWRLGLDRIQHWGPPAARALLDLPWLSPDPRVQTSSLADVHWVLVHDPATPLAERWASWNALATLRPARAATLLGDDDPRCPPTPLLSSATPERLAPLLQALPRAGRLRLLQLRAAGPAPSPGGRDAPTPARAR